VRRLRYLGLMVLLIMVDLILWRLYYCILRKSKQIFSVERFMWRGRRWFNVFCAFEGRVFMGFCDLEEVSRMGNFDTLIPSSPPLKLGIHPRYLS